MLESQTCVLERDSSPIRFAPLGPDVFGHNQPQLLLGTIEEHGEALLDLVDQHVVSIMPFRPETLLQLFRLAAKYESNPSRYIRHNTPLTGKILINAFTNQAREPGCHLTVPGTGWVVIRSTSQTAVQLAWRRVKRLKMLLICLTTTEIAWCSATATQMLFTRCRRH